MSMGLPSWQTFFSLYIWPLKISFFSICIWRENQNHKNILKINMKFLKMIWIRWSSCFFFHFHLYYKKNITGIDQFLLFLFEGNIRKIFAPQVNSENFIRNHTSEDKNLDKAKRERKISYKTKFSENHRKIHSHTHKNGLEAERTELLV